ncbi:MAG: hypothetical protein V3U98_07440 [Acidobacteriota bacterium]
MRGRRSTSILVFRLALLPLCGALGCAGASEPPPSALILVGLEPVSPEAEVVGRETDPEAAGKGVSSGGRIVAVDSSRPEGRGRWITRGFWSASEPAVSYDGRTFLFAGRREHSELPRIWEMRIDGSGARAITDGSGDPRHARYLPDGRIVFSDLSEEPGTKGKKGGRSLFVCNPDGSQLRRITFGTGEASRPSVLKDGRILFAHRPNRGGHENNATSTLWMTVRPDGSGIARFPGVATITRAALPPGWKPAEPYRTVSAVAAAPRPAPRALTSVVNDATESGRLLCLDVRESRLSEVSSLDPGAIVAVRVLGSGRGEQELLLNQARVEPDGSFFLEVPANVPLRLVLVGSDGRTVAGCDGNLWVRPNENRACIGCHEHPERSPENRVPLAVRRQPAPLVADAAARGAAGSGR